MLLFGCTAASLLALEIILRYRLFTWHAALQTTVQMKSSQNDAFDFEPPFVYAAFAQLTNGFRPLPNNNNNNNNFCKDCSGLSGKKCTLAYLISIYRSSS